MGTEMLALEERNLMAEPVHKPRLIYSGPAVTGAASWHAPESSWYGFGGGPIPTLIDPEVVFRDLRSTSVA